MINKWAGNGDSLIRSSLSTIKAVSRSNLSVKKTDSVLSEIESCFKIIDSANLSNIEQGDFVSVENRNQANIAFGRVLSQFTNLIRKHTLTSLKEVMMIDHQYLSGIKADEIETDVSGVNSSDELSKIELQLQEIENWLR